LRVLLEKNNMNLMQKISYPTLSAGALAGLIYVLIMQGVLVGVLVLLVPVCVLFAVGLRYGASAQSMATMVACGVVLLFAGVDVFVQFALMLALPSWVFGRQLMKIRLLPEGGVEWFPVGGAFIAYTLYCFAVLLVLGLYSMQGVDTGLLASLQKDVDAATVHMDAEVVEVVRVISRQFPYVILSVFIWSWGMLIYGAAVLAHGLCDACGRVLRRNVKITSFLPPKWWLGPLLLSGLMAMTQNAEMAFIGMTGFITLMLPYFLCGISLIHRDIARFSHSIAWFGMFYFILLVGQWPVIFMVTMYGLAHHLFHVYRMYNK
jgi:hypothetical protein